MTYGGNVARRRYAPVSNEQRLKDHIAFRKGKAYVALWEYFGVKGADDICWALSKGTDQQEIQWLEWYVDKLRLAC